MLHPPTSLLLLLHEPPTTRPVYDIPPVIVSSPRRPRLRALAARLTRTQPATGGAPSGCNEPAAAPAR